MIKQSRFTDGWIGLLEMGIKILVHFSCLLDRLPFNTVEKESFRFYSKLPPLSIDTFMKYMKATTKSLEKTIAQMLPDKFVLL
jgi:hypothetical protein